MSANLSKDTELALEAYKLLVNIVLQEEKMVWDRTQTFLIINGALVTAVSILRGVIGTNEPAPPKEIYYVVCIVGFWLGCLWLSVVLRSKAFYDHWFEQLRYLETTHLSPINIYNFAEDYFVQGKLTLGKTTFLLPRRAKLIPIYTALAFTSVLFILIWVAIAIFVALTSFTPRGNSL